MPIAIGLGVGTAATLGLVVGVGIFEPEARALVPVGGMVIGNAMTATAVALNRLADEMRRSAPEVEAALSLGATAGQASAPLVRRALASGLIPLVDQTKTTGVVFFPGTMVGMLLAGAEPFDAVRLQLILLYVLLGAVAISSLIAVNLAQRRFFTPRRAAARAAAFELAAGWEPEAGVAVLRALPRSRCGRPPCASR